MSYYALAQNRIGEKAPAPADGPVLLSGVIAKGHRLFASAYDDGDVIEALLISDDQTEWEIGEVSLSDDGEGSKSLSRDSVHDSSDNGNVVVFTKPVTAYVIRGRSWEEELRLEIEDIQDTFSSHPTFLETAGLIDLAIADIVPDDIGAVAVSKFEISQSPAVGDGLLVINVDTSTSQVLSGFDEPFEYLLFTLDSEVTSVFDVHMLMNSMPNALEQIQVGVDKSLFDVSWFTRPPPTTSPFPGGWLLIRKTLGGVAGWFYPSGENQPDLGYAIANASTQAQAKAIIGVIDPPAVELPLELDSNLIVFDHSLLVTEQRRIADGDVIIDDKNRRRRDGKLVIVNGAGTDITVSVIPSWNYASGEGLPGILASGERLEIAIACHVDALESPSAPDDHVTIAAIVATSVAGIGAAPPAPASVIIDFDPGVANTEGYVDGDQFSDLPNGGSIGGNVSALSGGPFVIYRESGGPSNRPAFAIESPASESVVVELGVDISDVKFLHDGSDWTMLVVYRTPIGQDGATPMYFGTSGGEGAGIIVGVGTGTVEAYVFGPSGGPTVATGVVAGDASNTHHKLVITCDGGDLVVRVDGVQVATAAISGTPSSADADFSFGVFITPTRGAVTRMMVWSGLQNHADIESFAAKIYGTLPIVEE